MDASRDNRQVRSAPDSVVTSPVLEHVSEDHAHLHRSQSFLRQAIKDIHSNEALSALEKAHKVQELMTGVSKAKKTFSRANSPLHLPSDLSAVDISGTYHPTSRDDVKVFGCAHYRTNSKVMAECCGSWHPCRFCHDEWSEKESDGHLMDRFAVRFMLCQGCKQVQPAGQVCVACSLQQARYYCGVCKLFDDDADKKIFHCDGCGICRAGDRDQFRHCDRCHGCISSGYYPKHKCLEGSLDADCPICGERLFVTVMPIMFMPCGHAIHSLCFHQHARESYQCPVCLKSVGDMTDLYRNIDAVLSLSTMPPEYSLLRAEILCNDCERRSVTKYHFLYHKCSHCAGYNTKLIKSFAAGQEQVVVRGDEGGVREGDIVGVEGIAQIVSEVSPVVRPRSVSPALESIREGVEVTETNEMAVE